MGQCGCGDYIGLVRFPGPVGFVYVLEVYNGCPDCQTGLAVRINRFSDAEAKAWNVDDLPELKLKAEEWWGNEDWTLDVVDVLSPDLLKARLLAFNEEFKDGYEIDGFIEDAGPGAMRNACADTVEAWLDTRRTPRS